jgi:hypothetical protein
VGQHVQLSGTLGSGTSGNQTLDATAGSALLIPTTLTGTVSATAGNLVTVSLQSLDGQAPSSFTFTGTGTSSTTDAMATAYTVSVPASLSTSSATVGTPVRFTGFVSPFGTAPPDFTADELVSYANTKALLVVRWAPPGDATPFATSTATELLLSQATLAASAQHQLSISFDRIDPSTLTAGLELVPDATASHPAFAIGHRSSWKEESFTTFADFVTALTTDLAANDALEADAYGPYDAATGVLSVDQMVVILND